MSRHYPSRFHSNLPTNLCLIEGTEFRFKGLTGYSIEFKRDADGIVTEAAFEQPFSVVTAKKKIAK